MHTHPSILQIQQIRKGSLCELFTAQVLYQLVPQRIHTVELDLE